MVLALCLWSFNELARILKKRERTATFKVALIGPYLGPSSNMILYISPKGQGFYMKFGMPVGVCPSIMRRKFQVVHSKIDERV